MCVDTSDLFTCITASRVRSRCAPILDLGGSAQSAPPLNQSAVLSEADLRIELAIAFRRADPQIQAGGLRSSLRCRQRSVSSRCLRLPVASFLQRDRRRGVPEPRTPRVPVAARFQYPRSQWEIRFAPPVPAPPRPPPRARPIAPP